MGRIVGAVVLAALDYGNRFRVQELHSTKGWKPPYTTSARRFPWAPVIGAFHPAPNRKERQPSDAGRLMRNRTPSVVAKVDLMAHGWYRRKMLLQEAEAASHG
jgi:hypothetical protein